MLPHSSAVTDSDYNDLYDSLTCMNLIQLACQLFNFLESLCAGKHNCLPTTGHESTVFHTSGWIFAVAVLMILTLNCCRCFTWLFCLTAEQFITMARKARNFIMSLNKHNSFLYDFSSFTSWLFGVLPPHGWTFSLFCLSLLSHVLFFLLSLITLCKIIPTQRWTVSTFPTMTALNGFGTKWPKWVTGMI